MNDLHTTCSDHRLRSLLQSDDVGDESKRSASHLDQCSHCQARLEQLAANPAVWRDVKESLLAIGDDESGKTDAVGQRPWVQPGWQRNSTAWNDSMARQLLSPPSHPEMLGRIGRYEVERLIGVGGMGVVFKAFDTELNRPVAVKVLAPYLAGSGAARKRFAREARAAAAVVHEHVVAIHNVETDGEAPFLVMQFVAGESLQQRIDRVGPLELCEILRIAMQTAAGLAAAHAQGLVHRDVKPSNILLEQGIERTLLTDFGLARASDDASLTHTGYHPGTPQYMSPEQARGESIDARSDLFSLGSVIYTMCTGRAPFRAETNYGVLRRITDNEPRPIREVNPLIPDWFERLVSQLHAKSPEQRFATAGKAHELLEQCLAHVQQPTQATLPAELQRTELLKSLSLIRRLLTGIRARRRRPQFSIASALLVIMVLGCFMGFLQWRASGLRHLKQGVSWAQSLGGDGSLVDDGRFFENHGLNLNLENSRVQDSDLRTAATFREIHSIDLDGTAITDNGLRHLGSVRGLVYVSLHQTQVTRAGIDRFVTELGYVPQIRMPVSGFYDELSMRKSLIPTPLVSPPANSQPLDPFAAWDASSAELQSLRLELPSFESRSQQLWGDSPRSKTER